MFISDPEEQHGVQVRLELHRGLDRCRPRPHRLHPVQPGRRLHPHRQGEGGRHEHAVPHARLPPEAAGININENIFHLLGNIFHFPSRRDFYLWQTIFLFCIYTTNIILRLNVFVNLQQGYPYGPYGYAAYPGPYYGSQYGPYNY